MTRTATKRISQVCAAAALASAATLIAPLAPAAAGSLDQATVASMTGKGVSALRGFFLPGVMPRAALSPQTDQDTPIVTLADERLDITVMGPHARPRARAIAGTRLDDGLAFLPETIK